jgi:hypothetical protein
VAGAILFVVGNDTALTAGETFLQSRWTAAGYTVTLLDDSASAPSPVIQDGVIVSQAAANPGSKWNACTKPVLALGMDHSPHSSFSNGASSVGSTMATMYLFNLSPAHPWLASISGLPKAATILSAATVPMSYRLNTSFGTAAKLVAASRVDLQTRITGVTYESGDLLADNTTTSPSRRGCLALRDTDIPNLTGDGLTLLDNAVAWAATAAAPTATVTFRSRPSYAITASKNAASQTAVPVADISNTGTWTKQDGVTTSNLFQAVSDADDATYLQSPNNPSAASVRVKFGTVSLGGGTSGWRFRVRSRLSGTGSSTAVAKLIQGASTVIATRSLAPGASFADEEFTLTSGEAAAITDGADLRLEVIAG